MKTPSRSGAGISFIGLAALVLLAAGCGRSNDGAKSTGSRSLKRQMKQFAEQKEAQARDAAKAKGQSFLPEYQTLFDAAAKDDWDTVQKTFAALSKRAPQFANGASDDRLTGTPWAAVLETDGAMEALHWGGEKYSTAFGRDIIAKVPPGSIYFGGTDPGRFVITAMCKSHVNADPFFTLTQNALADGSYLGYLREMYGAKISVPTAEDLDRCFQEYSADALRRKERNQLKPGENIKIVDGKPQASGIVAVMGINAVISKTIFDRNPDHEFFAEESFAMDWMYPHAEPHGLIFRLNRAPLSSLSETSVASDREYWTHYVEPMIGSWLKFETPLQEVIDYVNKVHFKKQLDGFKGDPEFLKNNYAHSTFSKLRSSIANIYLWRVDHAGNVDEKNRMMAEADFALRQAWALSPDMNDVVLHYVNFLAAHNRIKEAVLVGEAARHLPGLQIGKGAGELRDLIKQLKARSPS
jgi:hypothetical protein